MQTDLLDQRYQILAEVSEKGAALTSLSYSDPKTGKSIQLMEDWETCEGEKCRSRIVGPITQAISDSGKVFFNGKEREITPDGFYKNTDFSTPDRESGKKFSHFSARFSYFHSPKEVPHFFPSMHMLKIEYRADDDNKEIRMSMEMINLSGKDMPFFFGFSPAWAWPLPGNSTKDGHKLSVKPRLPSGTQVYWASDERIFADRVCVSPFNKDGIWQISPEEVKRNTYCFVYPQGKSPRKQLLAYGSKEGPVELRINLYNWDGFSVGCKSNSEGICIMPFIGHPILNEGAQSVPNWEEICSLKRIHCCGNYNASIKIQVVPA